MLRRASIQDIELDVIQPAHVHGEGKLMAPLTMSRISDALTAEGLATEIEAQQILTELNHVAADRETVISLPRIFQVRASAGTAIDGLLHAAFLSHFEYSVAVVAVSSPLAEGRGLR